MKAFIASLLIFVLMITGIAVNYQFVNTSADSLFLMTDRLPALASPDCYTQLSRLEQAWDRHFDWFSLSVNDHTLQHISDLIAAMQVLAAPSDTPPTSDTQNTFETCRVQLLLAIKELRSLENWSVWNFI